MAKFYPEIGDKLYLQQMPSGNYYADIVKQPYTVILVEDKQIIVQRAKLIFDGPRYYDSYPRDIQPDPNGSKEALRWSVKNDAWITDNGYPWIAHFGEYDFVPYMD